MDASNPMDKCGAKTKSGGICKKPAMANGRCDMHGGKSTGAPLTAGGRYSKFLPTRLAGKYEEAVNDAELISVKEEAAILQAFIANALAEIDLENCEAMWDTMQVLAKRWRDADAGEQLECMRQMVNAIEDGVEEWRKVHRMLTYIEQKRKLAETEHKRLKDLQAMLDARQVNTLIGALLAIINKHVPDHDVRSRVASEFAGLVHNAA